MSAAQPLEPWEHDNAHQALDGWLYAWRQHHQDGSHPPLAFLLHLGADAVELMQGSTPKVELARLLWACAEDGVCIHGYRWNEPLPDPTEGVAA
jgi:hypothetical protein